MTRPIILIDGKEVVDVYRDETLYGAPTSKAVTEKTVTVYTDAERKALEAEGYHVVTDSDLGSGGEV